MTVEDDAAVDRAMDAKLGILDTSIDTMTPAQLAQLAMPFPPEVQEVLRRYKIVPDEMIDIRPEGHLYVSNVWNTDILNEAFGINGWTLVPTRSIQEKKTKKGKYGEYEIVTHYQAYAAFAHGRFVRNVAGAGTYFSNNPAQNFASALETAESYAINRLAKRFGIGRNVRDKAFQMVWRSRYAFQDSADANNWKKKPEAEGVPIPPSGCKTWGAGLVRRMRETYGDEAPDTALAESLRLLTTEAWGLDRATTSFRAMSNAEAYDLCKRLGEGVATLPKVDLVRQPQRRSSIQAPALAGDEWSPERQAAHTAAHEDGPPCIGPGCQVCNYDKWENGPPSEAAQDEPSESTETPVTSTEQTSLLSQKPTGVCRKHGEFFGPYCEGCINEPLPTKSERRKRDTR